MSDDTSVDIAKLRIKIRTLELHFLLSAAAMGKANVWTALNREQKCSWILWSSNYELTAEDVITELEYQISIQNKYPPLKKGWYTSPTGLVREIEPIDKELVKIAVSVMDGSIR